MSDTDLAFRATLDGSGFASGMQNINSQIQDMGFRTGAASANLGSIGTVLGTLANPMTAFALAATTAGAALAGSVQAAAAFQTSMSGVAKTTGLGGSDLQGLSQQILDMSTNMPMAASELANIAQVAGSLGVAKENIAGFTEVAAQMGVAFEMPAEQAATSAAKILNSFGQPINAENMRAFGNVVNSMGDNFAATEGQVMDFVNRASFLNATFGQTIPQVAALGTVMISAGMDADVASTGIKSLLNMGLSETSKTGGIKAWADLLGTSIDEVKQKVGTDLSGTLVQTADKLAEIEDPVKRFQTAVALVGTEGAPALLKLVGQADNLKNALGSANSEWKNGSSLMKTFEANSATLDSQWAIFTNTINKAGVELGNVLLPFVTQMVAGLTDLTKMAIMAGESLYSMTSGAASYLNGGMTSLVEWYAGVDIDGSEKAAQANAGAYVDEFGNEILDSDYSFLQEKTTEEGIKAGDEAGKATAEAFTKANEDYIKSHSSGGYSEALMRMMAGQGSDTPTGDDLAKIVGKTTIAGFDFIVKDNNKLYLPDGSTEYFTSSRDLANRLVPVIEEYIGGSTTELQRAEILGDIQAQIRLKLSPEFVPYQEWILNEGAKAESDWKALGDAWTSALKDGVLSQAEADGMMGLAKPLRELEQLSPELFAKFGGESGKAFLDAVQAQDWQKAGEIAAGMFGAGFEKNLVGGAALVPKTIAELIADPAALQAAVTDINRFWEGTLIPTLKKNAEEAKAAFDSGQFTNEQIYENYIKPLDKLNEYLPGWVEEINRMFKSGELDIEGWLYIFDAMTGTLEKANEKVKDQTVGYDNLKKAIEDCADCAVSDFGQWQEAQDNLFQDSYIGQGGQGYLDWKMNQMQAIAETQAAMKAVGGVSLGQQYDMQDIKLGLSLDTTQAEADKSALLANIEAANPRMTMQMETAAAMAEVNALVSYIITVNPVMSVQVSVSAYADEIASMVDGAIRNALA